MFWNKNKDDKLSIIIKGVFNQFEDEQDSKIHNNIDITKEKFDGDYFLIVSTLVHYAALLYLENEEDGNRQDFLDWANRIYIGTVTNREYY